MCAIVSDSDRDNSMRMFKTKTKKTLLQTLLSLLSNMLCFIACTVRQNLQRQHFSCAIIVTYGDSDSPYASR